MSVLVKEVSKFNESIISNVYQGRFIAIDDKKYFIAKRSWSARNSEISNIINYTHNNFDDNNIIKNFYASIEGEAEATIEDVYKLSVDIDKIVQDVVDYNYSIDDVNIRNKYISMVKINILAPIIMDHLKETPDINLAVYNVVSEICNSIDTSIIKDIKDEVDINLEGITDDVEYLRKTTIEGTVINNIIQYKFGEDINAYTKSCIKRTIQFITNSVQMNKFNK